jgi:hypothetical protein
MNINTETLCKDIFQSDISEDQFFKILLMDDDEQRNNDHLEYEYDINKASESNENFDLKIVQLAGQKMDANEKMSIYLSKSKSKNELTLKKNLSKCKNKISVSNNVAIKSKKNNDDTTIKKDESLKLNLNSLFDNCNKRAFNELSASIKQIPSKISKSKQRLITNLLKFNLNRLGIVDNKLRYDVPKVVVKNIFSNQHIGKLMKEFKKC